VSTATAPALTASDEAKARRGDRLFKSVAAVAGSTITIAIGLIAIFLLVHAIPSLRANHANFFTSALFETTDSNNLAFGIRDLFMVTVLSSLCAMALAVPVAIGIAVFLTQYAPARLSRPFGALVDLLAAVPSIVFGLWGIFVLAPQLAPIEALLNRDLGWLFLFKGGDVSLVGGGNIFTAGVVLSVMMLPIVTSVSREVFRQTPNSHIEAAQALGATKWEVVRMTVLPFGRSGAVAASSQARVSPSTRGPIVARTRVWYASSQAASSRSTRSRATRVRASGARVIVSKQNSSRSPAGSAGCTTIRFSMRMP
jgi:phosphate transport system permease protein